MTSNTGIRTVAAAGPGPRTTGGALGDGDDGRGRTAAAADKKKNPKSTI